MFAWFVSKGQVYINAAMRLRSHSREVLWPLLWGPSACNSWKLHCNQTQVTTVIVSVLPRYTVIAYRGLMELMHRSRYRSCPWKPYPWLRTQPCKLVNVDDGNLPVLREVDRDWSSFSEGVWVTASLGIMQKGAVKLGVWIDIILACCCHHPINVLTLALDTFLTHIHILTEWLKLYGPE